MTTAHRGVQSSATSLKHGLRRIGKIKEASRQQELDGFLAMSPGRRVEAALALSTELLETFPPDAAAFDAEADVWRRVTQWLADHGS